ncbi:DNA -binding domain-containing protein [Litoreibacter roseus]|uniref:T6SS Transcription factor RovC-like DNA binding domain-containing protein n=1 Tax=Litoreibacter roseus TaxID=2601869 RepID=A0A6N6JJQ5_9RHOB|nr:DUF2285 domain-containing protein [Litoreibacter roseus]GFE66563.1 hypothetical protein KIN_36370 [Litoreibacter roseus]
MADQIAEDFADVPPKNDFVTDYDRQHLKLYARLLDAEADGAPLAEIVKVLFGIDAENEPERAQRLHAGHLGRARWMTENGYRSLIAG